MPENNPAAPTNDNRVELIDDNERLRKEIGGTTFYYRRLTSGFRGRVNKAHTKRGVTDYAAVTHELLQAAIVGWDNLGKANTPFDKSLISRLPDDVTVVILELAQAANGEEEKNS